MKLGLALGLAALALLAPWTASGTPLACASECSIEGHELAFAPPVFELKSGADVVWTSSSIGHLNVDGPGGESCFLVDYSKNAPSEPVRFDIVAGGLLATTSGEATACGNARGLPDGSFALPYVCILHPVMRGALVVTL